MNRNFISLIIAVLFSSASFAQQYEYKLTGITSKHTNDYYKYFYDDANGRVDSAVQYRELAGFIYDYTLKYIYDENGNEVLEKGYQKFSGDDFYTYSTQVRYTYDENGRILSRANYNLNRKKGEFELGGVYEYVYEGDKLVKRNTYVDEALTEKFEEVIYTYDDKGRLDEENVYSSFFGDEMTFSSGTKYIYDDKDRMVEKISTIGDFFTGAKMPAGGEVCTYDEAGNIVEWMTYSEVKEQPSSRDEYTHDLSLETVNTLYPVENEWDGTVYLNSKNAILSNIVYQTDRNTGEMAVYDELVMEYAPVASTGINVIRPAVKDMVQAVYADGRVRLTGVAENEPVRVYSQTGVLMDMKKYNSQEGINISSMPAGAYIISTRQGSVKVWNR